MITNFCTVEAQLGTLGHASKAEQDPFYVAFRGASEARLLERLMNSLDDPARIERLVFSLASAQKRAEARRDEMLAQTKAKKDATARINAEAEANASAVAQPAASAMVAVSKEQQ